MKTQIVQLTGATMIGGELISVGQLIEVTEREAKDLIARGRAIANDVKDAVENIEGAIDGVEQSVKAGRKSKA
jgi:uncharacterized protein YoxC